MAVIGNRLLSCNDDDDDVASFALAFAPLFENVLGRFRSPSFTLEGWLFEPVLVYIRTSIKGLLAY